MLVEGAIVDAAGIRPGYVRFRGSRVVEVGKLGTDSSHGREDRVRGIVVPPPVNGHSHLGDAVSSREPPAGSLADLVAPPDGWKFRLLRDTPEEAKRAAMRAALDRMALEGVAATIDFREEGLPGIDAIRSVERSEEVRVVALGRPLERPVRDAELAPLLEAADGIGLSSAREERSHDLTKIRRACRSAGKLFGLHASESVREDPDRYLGASPDLVVHLTMASEADLERVRASGATAAVCPRSNALFGRHPPLALLERLDVPTVLGTDNAMLHSPSVWRELEFAYVTARLRGERVSPEFLVRSACVTPWLLLGQADRARVDAGGAAPPLVVRLPSEDPAYQLACRTTEHLILRPGRRGPGPGRA